MGQGASFIPRPTKEGSEWMSRATAMMLKDVFLSIWGSGKATLLTVMVALTLATVTPAFAANGGNFILGSLNNTATTLTRLSGNVAGPALQIINNNAAANATALNLATRADRPPMRVNSATKVANLNADTVDGLDSTQLQGARAYAHINANGTIDASRSKNVNRVLPEPAIPGLYCVNSTVTPHNVVATIEGVANQSATDFGQITQRSANGAAQCNDGTNTYNISVSTGNKDGVLAAKAFDIAIN
jgi:hypothetical protein